METGGWIAAFAATAGLVAAFFLRARAPAVLVTVVLAAAGGGIGWGGMLIQDDPSVGEFAAAVVMLAVLLPAHVRIVLGPFEPRR